MDELQNDVAVNDEEKDDLDESLEVIEEEKEKEAEVASEPAEPVSDDPANEPVETEDGVTLTDVNEAADAEWGDADATPEGSDIPVSFEIIEAAGESLEQEGEAILDILGPSDDEAYNKLVLENEEGVVSYPDPDDLSNIITEDATGKEFDDFEGLSYDNDRDEYVSNEGDDTPVTVNESFFAW